MSVNLGNLEGGDKGLVGNVNCQSDKSESPSDEVDDFAIIGLYGFFLCHYC